MLYLVISNENGLRYVDLRKKNDNINEKWNNIYFVQQIYYFISH
jgi:hypothetical protein